MKREWLAIIAGAAMAVSGAAQTASSTKTTTTPSRVASSVTLPAGTEFEIRINDTLTSAEAQPGDRFTGTVTTDVTTESGTVVIPHGAEVQGRVLSAKPSGRLSDAGELQLGVSTIRSGGMVTNVATEPFVVSGQAHTKSNTTKIGGGAALGAIIGAVAGGGKGAAIGAGVGAAAGTAGAAATGKREAVVESEAVLKFVTASDTRVTMAANSTSARNASDQEPELRRRETAAGTGASGATDGAGMTGGSGTQPHAATVPGSATTTGPTTTAQPVASKPSNVWADDKADYFALSLRDKRVLTNCLQENMSSLPQGILIAGPTSTGLEKGQTLPASLGTKVRSLPLACERELPALPNNMERVLYGGRVLLLDESAKIVDIFAVGK